MSSFPRPDPQVLERLKALLGPSGWRDPAEAPRYLDDPRGRFTGRASLVLRPSSTDEVSQVLRLCATTGTPLIPYGGGTGVVAGQLSPQEDGAIVLSLERMNRIRAIDPADFAMVAEAGCVLADVHEAAAEHGLTFPLNMASRGSCTIGGNLATNAGGIQVLRHGNARDLCLGIEAVLPGGEVLQELSPLRKKNLGYDLRHLLIGSEGTLAVITAATLLLKPADPETVTALCAVESPAAAIGVLGALRAALGEAVTCMELISGLGIQLVRGHFPALQYPFGQPHPWFLLAEFGGAQGLQDRVEASLAELYETGAIADVVIATSEAQRQNLWDLRENMPEANKLTGAFCNSDTSVPIGAIDRFIAETHARLAGIHPGLRVNSYGHVGDGNIHHNVFPPEGATKADFLAANPGMIDTVRQAINEVTVECGGAISAEHGIGRLKPADLERFADPARVQMMQAIKRALDPKGILNPGALIPGP